MAFRVVVLPLPLGPMPVHLAGRQAQAQPVYGPHRAEGQLHPGQHQVSHRALRRRGVALQQARQQRRPRHHLPVGVQRTPAGAVQQLRNAAGRQQHDPQQQRRIQEGGPGHERRGQLRQHCQQHRRQQRTQNGAAVADQDGGEEQYRQVGGEGVRRDVALQRGEQRSRHPGAGAAEQEHRQQQRSLGHAPRLRRDLRIAQRHQAPAKPAEPGIGAQPRDKRCNTQAGGI